MVFSYNIFNINFLLYFYYKYIVENSLGDGSEVKKKFFEKSSRTEILECLNETMPFIKRDNYIVESTYPLTLLDLMELIIVLLMKKISVEKFHQSLRDYEEKLKCEQENAKKAKKSIRTVPKRK